MSARGSTRLAQLLLALAVTMLAASLVLAVMNGFRAPWDFGTRAQSVLVLGPALAFTLVGALLATRHPRNAVGWICLGCGVAIAFTAFVGQYALYGIEVRPGALPAADVAAWCSLWNYLLFVAPLGIYLVLLFPHGRLPSSGWRLVAWVGGLSAVLGGVADALTPGPVAPYQGLQNPYGLEGSPVLIDLLVFVGFFGLTSCMLASAGSMVWRVRRSRGVERQQLKWFAFAASALAITFFPVVMFGTVSSSAGEGSDSSFGYLLAQDLVMVLFAGLPIATGIAVTRYRLYDIDVVINRALVYGGLTATLAGTYLLAVLLLQLALSPLTESNGLAIAVSTLAVAALFGPARRRIQSAVDRRFYRRKYDAARTLAQFGARLRDEVDLTALGDELRSVVAEAMQPAHVSLWLRVPDESGARNDSRTSSP